MDFIHDALAKASAEGQIDKDMLPWLVTVPEVAKSSEGGPNDRPNPSDEITDLPSKLSSNLSHDVRPVVENILLEARESALGIIGILSATPQEGASTLAAMIALVTSERLSSQKSLHTGTHASNVNDLGRRVLLLDTHLKQPAVHKLFKRGLSPGLRELLLQKAKWVEAVKRIMNSKLHILPAGGSARLTLAEIGTDRLVDLLDSKRGKFQHLFLDLPPLLHSAESIAISQLCDGVILVIRAGQTRYQLVEEARCRLETAGVRVLGGVLNRRKFLVPERVYRKL